MILTHEKWTSPETNRMIPMYACKGSHIHHYKLSILQLQFTITHRRAKTYFNNMIKLKYLVDIV